MISNLPPVNANPSPSKTELAPVSLEEAIPFADFLGGVQGRKGAALRDAASELPDNVAIETIDMAAIEGDAVTPDDDGKTPHTSPRTGAELPDPGKTLPPIAQMIGVSEVSRRRPSADKDLESKIALPADDALQDTPDPRQSIPGAVVEPHHLRFEPDAPERQAAYETAAVDDAVRRAGKPDPQVEQNRDMPARDRRADAAGASVDDPAMALGDENLVTPSTSPLAGASSTNPADKAKPDLAHESVAIANLTPARLPIKSKANAPHSVAEKAELRQATDTGREQSVVQPQRGIEPASLARQAAMPVTTALSDAPTVTLPQISDPSPDLAPPAPGTGLSATSSPLTPAPVQTAADALNLPSQSAANLIAQPTATLQPISNTVSQDARGDLRLSPQLDSAIDHLTATRDAIQSSRPEMTVRHQEFGAITMRLEAMGGDLRATLSARDPGFVPAIQSALAERAVAASSETSAGHSHNSNNPQKGSEQQSAHTGSSAQGWGGEGRYGSSTGSGQGTSQPYRGQTDTRNDDTAPGERSTSNGDTAGAVSAPGERDIFA